MMTAVFSTAFIAGTIGFLIVFGLVLMWQERRIRRLEEQTWRVGPVRRRR